MLGSFLLRIMLALAVGTIIGLKTSTVVARMFAIICTGAALLTIVSTEFYQVIDYPWFSDPGRLSAQVLAALGFLGTGLIWISETNKVHGLSAAASIWVTAILGILIGSGLGPASLIVVVLLVVAFMVLG
jgi:putative Mg2+ transporter-C (MgtC) family protein